MKIGILQTGPIPDNLRERFGDYGEMFVRLLDGHGFSFAIHRVMDNVFPEAIDSADGWLITGSRHGAYEDLPWIARLEDFLREAYAAAVPLLGICFGHQVLAQALGGRVEKFAGGWAVGPSDYRLNGSGETLTLNAWHQDQVTVRPDGAEVIASSPFCQNAILAYGERALSIQPHPEFDADFLRGLIDGRGRGTVPDALLEAARKRLDTPLSTDRTVDMMAGFLARHDPARTQREAEDV